ncbi:interactor protein for cytohesin exchange factors 1 isoform X2 [Narcine bancroftii]|uniref:interactor protein for cytohesin exchange factors 1 isoform X2 n=1 Tax=Narcine bancroftii TaxID=1343680 RepID=UPI00383226A4
MSSSSSGTANGSPAVSLHSTRRKTQGSSITMSRRRISCKDLGCADLQGWLYKKKTSKSLIRNKWKKYWFVLKGTNLYWYTNQAAEKAEGFINLPEFQIDQGTECKKKHAIKASHSKHRSFYFAAENADDMSTWINRMGLAAIESAEAASEPKNEECWSESEQEDVEIPSEAPSSSQTFHPQEHPVPPFQTPFMPSETANSFPSPESTVSSASASAASLSQSSSQERQSWHNAVNSSYSDVESQLSTFDVRNRVESSQKVRSESAEDELNRISSEPSENLTAGVIQFIVGAEGTETSENSTVRGTCEKEQPQNSDEMEQLYKSLEQASLSPMGERRFSTKKDYRRSFIKRSKNPIINERLHKFRALNSTLKSKEADLAVINQLLENSQLTSEKFRQWKEDYSLLLQDICKGSQSKISSERNADVLENRESSSIETDV